MPVLAIDTSNKTLSVAIVKDEGTIVEQTVPDTLQHSVKLMPAIQEVLQESQVSMQELTGVIVAKGPGSYTGLRSSSLFCWTIDRCTKRASSRKIRK